MKEAHLRGTLLSEVCAQADNSCLSPATKYEKDLFRIFLGNLNKSFQKEIKRLKIRKITLRGLLVRGKIWHL